MLLQPLCFVTGGKSMRKAWDRFVELLSGRPFAYWTDHKLKQGTFELRGDVIVRGRGASESDFVRVSDIESWTDYGDPWIYAVPMRLHDGRTVEWTDPYSELERILRKVAPEKVKTEY